MKSTEEQLKCFVSEKATDEEKGQIQYKVCRDLSVEHQFNGEKYCILHFPNVLKHKNSEFNDILCKRIDDNLNDFRYVIFSDELSFSKQNFVNSVKFSNAVFYKRINFGDFSFRKVSFRSAIFKERVSFFNTIFNEEVAFIATKFNKRVSFQSTKFSDKANFISAVFSGNADFQSSDFQEKGFFRNTTFDKDVNFQHSIFSSKISFTNTKFNKIADFRFVLFRSNSEIYFNFASIKDRIYFRNSVFEGIISFEGSKKKPIFIGNNATLDLIEARLETVKVFKFKNVRLSPSWFINVDSRNFSFYDVDWENSSGVSKETIIELNKLIDRKITGRPHRLFTIACSQLATNYEDNKHFEQSSNFRRMSLQLTFWEKWISLKIWLLRPLILFIVKGELFIRKYKLPKQKIYNRWKAKNTIPYSFGQSLDIPHYLYRISSFYGESWSKAAFVLVLIVFAIFPFIYTQTEFQVTPKTIPLQVVVKDCPDVTEELKPVCKIENRGLYWSEAIPHSLATASLQTVEYRIPKTTWGSVWIILEKIFAPLQAALLALAIRRKFMR